MANDSFIARAREANDAGVLIGAFRSIGCFDYCLEGMQVVAIGGGSATCTLTVSNALANNFATLHGGAISTLVDVAGTLALLSVDPTRPGISIEMNQTFCAPARVGDEIFVRGTVLRYGRSLGFTQIDIFRGGDATGPLVATGRHTKAFSEQVQRLLATDIGVS